jgi:hypothetical protein
MVPKGAHQRYIVFAVFSGDFGFLRKLQILRSALTAPSALSAPSYTFVVPDFGPTLSGNSDVNYVQFYWPS